MSSLNSHLFGIGSPRVDSPNCNCSKNPETTKHYFFICSDHISQREELEKKLQNSLKNYNKMSMNGKLAVILHGRGLDNAAGLAVATSVQKFIRETKRFDS